MKKVIVASSIAALGVAGLVGGAAFATTNSNNGSDPMSNLASAIATKFNLNKDDVQKVVDEQKTAMQQERENEAKAELAQLVKDGKLTQAQADKITAKRAELQKAREAERTSNQTLTADQRKAKMDEQKTALDQWLKDNGIDSQYAHLLMGGRGGHGGGRGDRGGNAGPQQSQSTTSSSSSSSKSTTT